MGPIKEEVLQTLNVGAIGAVSAIELSLTKVASTLETNKALEARRWLRNAANALADAQKYLKFAIDEIGNLELDEDDPSV